MHAAQLIARKRDGQRLAPDEIGAFIAGYVRGEVPDYQMAAMAMAICCRGMEPDETAALAKEMLRSGGTLAWPQGGTPVVDKHSTGGVGDKVSLPLAPLLACCDVRVPMLSGRGLGATGGTLDKLEAIPGFRTDLDEDEIRDVVNSVGCVITGTTPNLVPADRKLYALRDVTGTVPSIPLITSSIMSKKLAEGLDALVLDVKFGSGAFMKSLADARTLAQSMVAVGREMGLKTSALVTDMNQPLGRMCGNAVEIDESIETLAGRGPADLVELTLAQGAELLVAVGRAANIAEARALLDEHRTSGRGLQKFREMVEAQGGDFDAPRPVAPPHEIVATHAGHVAAMNVEALGLAIVELGGGRKKITDQIDHSVGLEMMVRIGQPVERGQPLVRVFARPEAAARIASHVEQAITLSSTPVSAPALVAARIEA